MRVCRLALHRKYPKFGADGYEALYPRPPILYVSAASKPGLGQYLCSQVCVFGCVHEPYDNVLLLSETDNLNKYSKFVGGNCKCLSTLGFIQQRGK